MKNSDYISGFLTVNTQRAYAQKKARAADEEQAHRPATPEFALLRRIKKVVFGPSVKTLDQALDRFSTIVDSLDDSDKEKRTTEK
jgi:hypothetical protein